MVCVKAEVVRKTGSPQGLGGSTPSLSAEYTNFKKFVIFIKVLLCVCLFKDSYRNNKKFKMII